MTDPQAPRVGTLHVFTFKKGMLARLGHDLRLSFARFTVTLEGDEVRGRFDPASVRVDGGMVGGRLDPGAPPPMFHGEIVSNARDEVLQARRHPWIEFMGRWDPAAGEVVGELQLAGRTHPLTVPVRLGEREAVASVELAPSRWGIRPFKALGGTLKVQDRVRVELTLPLPGGAPPEGARWQGPAGPAE